jgi:predicted nucleotidyltransferase
MTEQPTELGSIDEIQTHLAGVLEEWPSVRAAWLFGSAVAGAAGPLSDVDVAVLGCAHLSLDERARLAADLARAVGRPVDLVSVERASPVLGMAVVDTGRRFLCRDTDAADAFEDFALRRYLGTAELRRIVNAHVREDLHAGR